MQSKLKYWWENQPLTCLLVAGLFFRLIAVVCSKGFGMIDDHFLIIEEAQSWVDRVNVGNWLPQLSKDATPPGFSYFYTGLNYLLLSFLNKVHIYDPQSKMYVVRLLHAVYSLLTIYFGFRITEKLTNRTYAKQVGILLALLWIWPFLSVRNLIEIVCIPWLMWATWLVVKKDKGSFGWYMLAGMLLGIAFNIRFQTSFFSAGFLLALLIKKGWWPAFAAGLGLVICAAVFQGGIDYFIWGKPFVEIVGYVNYNIKYATAYINLPWYTYLLFFAGILIPPVSIFLLTGFFRSYKKYLLLFLPSFVFLLFHSYFPNKQERFILPILPFILMLGTIGWNELVEQKGYNIKYRKALSISWKFFYGLNAILLVIISFTYTKKNRVEAMVYLSKKSDVKNLLVENSNNSDGIPSPLFYLRKWPTQYFVTNRTNLDSFYHGISDADQPNYAIFYEQGNLQKRVAALGQYYNLRYETTIYPSFIDDFMYRINPVNDNAVTYIYKIEGKK
jgi:hypothetical protein